MDNDNNDNPTTKQIVHFSTLLRFGIETMGISSDGDSRLLSAMRSKTNFNLSDLSEQQLERNIRNCEGIIYIQDTVHIGTKLRNRLLKYAALLPMGDKQVSIGHIKMLLNAASKECHGLVYHDICPEDKQNYGSLEKLMENRVIEALEKYIMNSDATVQYLIICKQVTSSFLDRELKAIERIYRIWNAVYFLRIWRKWMESTNYKTDDHFITANAFQCIEINAHALISGIQTLREKKCPELFLPELYASQPCEFVFRQMRSMGSVNYTKINFTLHELIHLIRRVELTSEIALLRLEKEKVVFPRIRKVVEASNKSVCALPTDQEIIETILRARNDALESASRFKMCMTSSVIQKCEIIITNPKVKPRSSFDIPSTEDSDSLTQDEFVVVENEDGTTKKLRKSTLVWLLTESNGKLSSDRLKRVQEMSRVDDLKKRRLMPSMQYNETTLVESSEVLIGDWCFFKSSDVGEVHLAVDNDVMKYCVIGNIIGFKHVEEAIETPSGSQGLKKKVQKKKYTLDYAPTSGKIAALATWYTVENGGTLKPVKSEEHFFIHIKHYLTTLKNPFVEEGDFKLRNEDLASIHSSLSKYFA